MLHIEDSVNNKCKMGANVPLKYTQPIHMYDKLSK